MGQLLLTVIPLSVGAAFSPTVLTLTVVILGTKHRPHVRVAVMILGMAIVLIGLTLLAATATSQVSGTGAKPLLYWLDVGLGASLLALALKSLLARPKEKESTASQMAKRRRFVGTLPSYLVIGSVLMITDFSSIVLYLPAVREITTSSVGLVAKLLTGILPFMAVLAPAFVPLLAVFVAPEKAGRGLNSLNGWLKKHSRVTSVVLSGVFGAYLLWHGMSRLVET